MTILISVTLFPLCVKTDLQLTSEPTDPVKNWSFEDRYVSEPGVYGSPYWNHPDGGWREFIGDICHTKIEEDGDGDVDQFDYWEFCAAFIRYWQSPIGFKTEDDYKADFDGDGEINQHDSWAFSDSFIRYYQIGYRNLDGVYSWYTNGTGEDYQMWQWLDIDVVWALAGEKVEFSFWFYPESVAPDGSKNNARARSTTFMRPHMALKTILLMEFGLLLLSSSGGMRMLRQICLQLSPPSVSKSTVSQTSRLGLTLHSSLLLITISTTLTHPMRIKTQILRVVLV